MGGSFRPNHICIYSKFIRKRGFQEVSKFYKILADRRKSEFASKIPFKSEISCKFVVKFEVKSRKSARKWWRFDEIEMMCCSDARVMSCLLWCAPMWCVMLCSWVWYYDVAVLTSMLLCVMWWVSCQGVLKGTKFTKKLRTFPMNP